MKDMKSLLCLLLAALMVTTLSIVALADVETIGKDTELAERFSAKVDYSQFDAAFGALDGVGETEYTAPPEDVTPTPAPTTADPISTDPAETVKPADTPKPAATAQATDTPEPIATAQPTDTAEPIATAQPVQTEQPETITGEQASILLQLGCPLDAVRILKLLVGLSE